MFLFSQRHFLAMKAKSLYSIKVFSPPKFKRQNMITILIISLATQTYWTAGALPSLNTL